MGFCPKVPSFLFQQLQYAIVPQARAEPRQPFVSRRVVVGNGLEIPAFLPHSAKQLAIEVFFFRPDLLFIVLAVLNQRFRNRPAG